MLSCVEEKGPDVESHIRGFHVRHHTLTAAEKLSLSPNGWRRKLRLRNNR